MKGIIEAVREQAKEEGRQEERAAIVAWLRSIEGGVMSMRDLRLAELIEAGEHLK